MGAVEFLMSIALIAASLLSLTHFSQLPVTQIIVFTGPAVPPPTLKELMNNVHTVKTFELGIQLDLELSDVNTAIADHKNDAHGQLIKILSLYVQQAEDPTWLHVATALYAIGENGCAADIEKKFGE